MSMTLVQTVTVGAGGASSIIFSNIPQSAGHLIVLASLRCTESTNNVGITLNNDTNSNYNYRVIQGNGTSVSSFASSYPGFFTQAMNDSAAPGGVFGSLRCTIPQYSTSGLNKHALIDGITTVNSSAGSPLTLTSAIWSNSAAVTSLGLLPGSGLFVQHSKASLYILAAS